MEGMDLTEEESADDLSQAKKNMQDQKSKLFE